MVRAHKREQNLHYAQTWSKKSANARNLKIGMGTVMQSDFIIFILKHSVKAKKVSLGLMCF